MPVHTQVNGTIEGKTPLLCNRFTDEAAMSATNGTRSSSKGGDKGSPTEIAEAKLYIGAKKKPVIPQPNLFRCFIDAGKFFKEGRSKWTSAKSSIIPACVELHGIEFPIISKEGWRVDERPVRNPMTGGRFLCWRPCFDDWKLTFNVTIDPEMMSMSGFRDLIDAAGKKIGLGDFRPDCKGPFGKFVVTSWKTS